MIRCSVIPVERDACLETAGTICSKKCVRDDMRIVYHDFLSIYTMLVLTLSGMGALIYSFHQ